MLLKAPLFEERAVGLGTKETVPSRPNAPDPNEDINELVRILKEEAAEEERDDRLKGDRGGATSLVLLFLDLLLFLFRLLLGLFGVIFVRNERTETDGKPMM